MCKCAHLGGSRGMLTNENFGILRSPRLILMQSEGIKFPIFATLQAKNSSLV